MQHSETSLAAEGAVHSPARIDRIVVFRALFLGDLICSLPALQRLRERFPAAHITLVGLPWAADLVRRTDAVDRLLEFPGYPGIREVPHDPARTAAFLEAARAEAYDLAIQMHGDGSVSNGFVAELGARTSLGYRRGDDAPLTHSLPHDQGEHEVHRWLRLVDALPHAGAAPAAAQVPAPRLLVTQRDRARAAGMLRGLGVVGPLVALHVGAKDPARRWPAEKFTSLADALQSRCGARIVLTGGKEDAPLTQAVARAVRRPVLDLAGATDIGGLAALLGRADLLVTNDTGASHMAAAVRTRSVVLFGPSRPELWGPLDTERHRAIDSAALAPDAASPAAALQALSVAAVLGACEEMLTRPRDDARPETNDQAPAAARERAVGE